VVKKLTTTNCARILYPSTHRAVIRHRGQTLVHSPEERRKRTFSSQRSARVLQLCSQACAAVRAVLSYTPSRRMSRLWAIVRADADIEGESVSSWNRRRRRTIRLAWNHLETAETQNIQCYHVNFWRLAKCECVDETMETRKEGYIYPHAPSAQS